MIMIMLYGLSIGGLAMFSFIVERLYREFGYWFGFGRSCKDEDSERGDAYVHQLIRNLIGDGRCEFDPCCLNDCFTNLPTFLLTFNKIQGRIEFCINSIIGLTSLKQADSCLTKKKDQMHISASLGAGPIQFDSWVTINVLGFERRFLVKGTLRYVKMLCDFTVNSENDRNGSLERLLISELKEIKFEVRKGLGFLKVLINPVISLLIVLLKTFVRHGIECALESYVRKTLPKYKFPIEGNASEKNEHNPEVLEDPSKRSPVSKQNNNKYISWCDCRSSDLTRKPSRSYEKCASNVVEQSKTKIKTSQTRTECYFLDDSFEVLDGCMADAYQNQIANESMELLERFSVSSEECECMMGQQVVDFRGASEQVNQIWSSADGISLSDEISLCKSRLNDTFQNALKPTYDFKNFDIDHCLAVFEDSANREKTAQVNSEGRMSEMNQNTVSTREQSVETPFIETTSQFTRTLEKGLEFNTEDTMTIKSAHGCIPDSIENGASKNILEENLPFSIKEYLSPANTNSVEPVSDVEQCPDCQPIAIGDFAAALNYNKDEVLTEIIKNNEERLHFLQELMLQMEEIPKDTKIAFEKPLLQHKLNRLEENLEDSEQITTLPIASDETYERIKAKVKIFHETEIREYAEETLPFKDEVEYAATKCDPGEESALEKLPPEAEVESGTCIVAEKVYATCIAKVATEEAQVKFPLAVETIYLGAKSESENATEEAKKVTSKVETEYTTSTSEYEFVSGGETESEEKLSLEAECYYDAATCQQVEKGETNKEISPIEVETEYAAAPCVAEVEPENCQEKLLTGNETEYLAPTYEPRAHTSKEGALKRSPIKIQIKHAFSTSQSQVSKDRRRHPRNSVTSKRGILCPLKLSTLSNQ